MRLAKVLATLFLFSSFTFSQNEPLTASLLIDDVTPAIDDVKVKVIAKGGKKPYRFIWNKENISIYNDSFDRWSEGDSIKVLVIDANGDSVSTVGCALPNSFSEHMNNIMKPAVAFLQKVLFTNIWSDTVKVNEFVMKAPFAVDAKRQNYTLKEWVKKDGETVKHLEVIAILQDGDEEFPFYAMGDGTLIYGTHSGEKIKA